MCEVCQSGYVGVSNVNVQLGLRTKYSKWVGYSQKWLPVPGCKQKEVPMHMQLRYSINAMWSNQQIILIVIMRALQEYNIMHSNVNH